MGEVHSDDALVVEERQKMYNLQKALKNVGGG